MQVQVERAAMPGRWALFVFALNIGALSNFFAEAAGGSTPLVLVSPAGWLIVFPTYALHVWTLAAFVLRRGRSSLVSLYLAGTVFGLYEAYITKILWSPTWNPHAWRIGGVAVLETLLLVLFWHPLMAFVIPAIAAERWLTGRRTLYDQVSLRLRRFLERRDGPVWAGVLLGANHGMMCRSPLIAAASFAGSAVVLVALAHWWRRQHAGADHDVADLMPRGRAGSVLVLALAGWYALMGHGIRPEALPGWRSQATIWLLYVILGGLAALSIRRMRPPAADPASASDLPPLLSPTLVRFMAAWAVTSLVASIALTPVFAYGTLALWAVAIPTGCVIFARCVRTVLGTAPPPA